MVPIHEQLAAGRWHTLSLMEQLANVGNAVDPGLNSMRTTIALLREGALNIFLSEDSVFPSIDEREEFKLVSHRPTFLRARQTAPLHKRPIVD